MSSYEGLEASYAVDGMPGKQKIARKPRGVGMELKSVADGDTKCILRVEMHEGKTKQSLKRFNDLGSGCAFIQRLCEPWRFGSNRTVVADSAFSSLNTCEQLLSRGLLFMGMVTTAHKRFPKLYMNCGSRMEEKMFRNLREDPILYLELGTKSGR